METERFTMPRSRTLGLSLALLLSGAPCFVSLLADAPAAPEPIVNATIAKSGESGSACLVSLEVREAGSDEVLSAPKIQVAQGQEAGMTTSEGGRSIEIRVRATAGCAGGAYTVRVLTNGTLSSSKTGPLQPK